MDTITISKDEFTEKSAKAVAELFIKAIDNDAKSAATHVIFVSPLIVTAIKHKLFDEADPEAELAEAVKGEEE